MTLVIDSFLHNFSTFSSLSHTNHYDTLTIAIVSPTTNSSFVCCSMRIILSRIFIDHTSRALLITPQSHAIC